MSCSTVASHHPSPSMHLFSLLFSHSYTLGNTSYSHDILHVFYHHLHAIILHCSSCGALFCCCLEACRSSASEFFQDFTKEKSGMKETKEGKESREKASGRRIWDFPRQEDSRIRREEIRLILRYGTKNIYS